MHFEKQQHQEDCVENIISVLEKCDVPHNDFSNLSEAIGKLWKEKGYTQFRKEENKKRLDVLMETGTGKTFTYLKTIFEIHKKFERKKFIIVLPRTAIKLGVIQNVNLTKDHFFHQYGKRLKIIKYPEEGLEKVRQDFIRNDDFCVLITTNSAFNSEKNTINQANEKAPTYQPKLKGLEEHVRVGSVWESIRDKKPIVIIDEPHLLKGTETQKGLDKLTDSLQIRFGATFPTDKKDEAHHLSNVVYSLDSISAFREYLVKGITVHTLISEEEQGGLKVSFIESRQNAFMVVYDINGVVYRKRLLKGEDIGVKTGLTNYKNVKAIKIAKDKDDKKDKVYLDNRTVLELSKGGYDLGDEEIRYMIRTTIDKHFDKEERLFKKGIKALSLFFIPRVANFREHEKNPKPRIKTIFEKLYREKRAEVLKNPKMDEAYKKYLQKDIDEQGKLQVHEGYFSGDKGTKDKQEADGVNIILNEKQKLLSFDTPLRFIFSVWALQEGWDNPNIFTICKLADTTKETSRRQQVGRGLRIAVNQAGNRLTYKKLNEKDSDFYNINTLDMVVSGKEKEFIQAIQKEIQEASFSLVGDTLSLDDLKHLKLSETEAKTVIETLEREKIINDEGQIKLSVYEFLKNNRDKLDEVSNFMKREKINDERYQFILKIFTDNRGYIKDGSKKVKDVKIRQDKWKEFKTLWETINKKSKIVYKNIDENKIIEKVATLFNEEEIKEITIRRHTQSYDVQSDEIVGSIVNESETDLGKVDFFKSQSFVDFLNFFVKKEKFLFPFMVKLLNKIDEQQIRNNPKKARERLLEILKNTIHGQILSKVNYEFLDTSIYPNDLQTEQGREKLSIRYTLLGKDFEKEKVPDYLLYDTICWDSNIEKEVQEEDPKTVGDNNKITVFAKLPKISIPTPYKTYNPDFAYLIKKQGGEKLFLVVETKGYNNESDIPKEEKQKINYAKKFFKALQKELKDVQVRYETRLNSEKLSQIIKRAEQ